MQTQYALSIFNWQFLKLNFTKKGSHFETLLTKNIQEHIVFKKVECNIWLDITANLEIEYLHK